MIGWETKWAGQLNFQQLICRRLQLLRMTSNLDPKPTLERTGKFISLFGFLADAISGLLSSFGYAPAQRAGSALVPWSGGAALRGVWEQLGRPRTGGKKREARKAFENTK